MNAEALFSSNSDEWATPQDVFNSLDSEFHFTLDPCATDENYKCEKYFTIDQDGLKKSWGGGNMYSVIRRTHKLQNGSKKHTEKAQKITQWYACLYRQELIQNIFTGSYYTGAKSDL